MQTVLLAIATLACPVGMGVTMLMMMRGRRSAAEPPRPESGEEVARLRREVQRLRAGAVSRG